MYLKNPYYLEALKKDGVRTLARVQLTNTTLINEDIKNVKYDLSVNDSDKFTIGGAYGATITLKVLNIDGNYDDVNWENEIFKVDLKLSLNDLYTVGQVHKELVPIINDLKIKHITSLWVPQGVFVPDDISKDENQIITIKLIDKSKYLNKIYLCSLTPPFSLKQLYNDALDFFQITSDTESFVNEDVIIDFMPEDYTGKQIFGWIAECACGFFLFNRIGNAEIRKYGKESVKTIEKR